MRPPAWESGAALSVSLATSSSLVVTWPPATDDRAMGGYRLYLDGKKIEQIEEPPRASTEIGELIALTTYELQLEPFDAAGNAGPRLTATARTGDGTHPTWPDGAVLGIQGTPIASGWRLQFSWPAAVDDTGVVEYRLQVCAELSAHRVRAPDASVSLDLERPPETYTLVALDGAVNVSAALVGTWTPPPPD